MRMWLECFSHAGGSDENRWPLNHLVKCKATLTNASNAALMFDARAFAGGGQRHGMMPITKRGS